MIVQPLAIISSHFDSIAKGDLARPVAVFGERNFGDLCQPEGDAGIAAGNGIRRASGQLCHAHRDLRDCGG
jgi:hypothetical protein